MAAPGIGGVSLGNDGRWIGTESDGRVLRTNAVAGVSDGERAGVGGALGGALGGSAAVAPVWRIGAWNPRGVGRAGRTGSEGATGAGVTLRGVRRITGANDSGAASASDSMIARSVSCQTSDLSLCAAAVMVPRRCIGASVDTRITAPHTEHRARTPPGGTFAGSTRKTDWHSPHETFNAPPTRLLE